eukprot:CAMPEP_0182828704 /NCGR_PEP_ID=MMETSP0006_2-20121128/17621_1 /TAXON_ID=97485 /ORGANISM="Prymnesium parvum, Strain Texoma1" /LENGTH=122 /DNA_ID=CAMNT_0024956097 /DNA_START=196 /DNA_END=560 /DNA_ORIENTATION=-
MPHMPSTSAAYFGQVARTMPCLPDLRPPSPTWLPPSAEVTSSSPSSRSAIPSFTLRSISSVCVITFSELAKLEMVCWSSGFAPPLTDALTSSPAATTASSTRLRTSCLARREGSSTPTSIRR